MLFDGLSSCVKMRTRCSKNTCGVSKSRTQQMDVQYGISQPTSYQRSRAVADCFHFWLSWLHHKILAKSCPHPVIHFENCLNGCSELVRQKSMCQNSNSMVQNSNQNESLHIENNDLGKYLNWQFVIAIWRIDNPILCVALLHWCNKKHYMILWPVNNKVQLLMILLLI